MAAVTRRQYKGGAAATTITAALTNVGTSTTLTATTGWPSAASVPFYVVIDPGNSSEEKCSATISGSTLTLTRGADDTTAVAHSSGATIYPVFSADEADEANLFASTMTTRGDLLTMGSGPSPARLALGALGYVLGSDGTDILWTNPAPAGIVSAFAGSTAPSGWLMCFGQAVNRTTYSTLFTALGTTYGVGDGSTTFNIPDMRGRAIAGVDNMGGTAASRLTSTVLTASNTLGATGGTQTHILTTAQLASHNHTQDSHNHSQNAHGHSFDSLDGYNQYTGVSNRAIGVQGGGGVGGYVLSNTATNNATTATNQATGGDTAHLNTQPTIVLNYIIKATL